MPMLDLIPLHEIGPGDRPLVGGKALSLGLLAAACSSKSDASTGSGSFTGAALTGAGATFPDPIYEQWFKDFRSVEPDAKINYQAIGSGGGVEQFTAKTVDFGASDAPLAGESVGIGPIEPASA